MLPPRRLACWEHLLGGGVETWGGGTLCAAGATLQGLRPLGEHVQRGLQGLGLEGSVVETPPIHRGEFGLDLQVFSLHGHSSRCRGVCLVAGGRDILGEGVCRLAPGVGFTSTISPSAEVNKIVYLLCVFPETYQIPQCSRGPAPVPGSPTATLNNSLTKAFNLLSSPGARALGHPCGVGGTLLLQRCGERVLTAGMGHP